MSRSIANTKDPEVLAQLARQQWDAIVVGAGPAGSIAARELARRGQRVLLIDKATFPRRKVCGGCLNPEGAELLVELGLPDLLSRVQAQPLKLLSLHCSGRQANLNLTGNFAVARDVFDHALADEAAEAGACVITGVEARPDAFGDGCRWVSLSQAGSVARTCGRIVIVAAGLNGWHEIGPMNRRTPVAKSRIGVGTILRECPPWLEPNVIHMSVSQGGYVGMVQLAHGQLDIAAAFEKDYLSNARGPAAAVANVLREAGFVGPKELGAAQWFGTPAFTHRLRSVATPRTFFIGDAAGYVEPFTGEGMTWAMQSARAVTDVAIRSIAKYHSSHLNEWQTTYQRLLGRKMFVCGLVGKLLSHQPLARIAMAVLSWAPWLGRPLICSINHSRWPRFSVS